MDLKNKQCAPCNKGTSPIEANQLEKYLHNVPQWNLRPDNNEIQRSFKFKNFSAALEFVNKVGEIAERENHHPDIAFGWGYCHIKLSTHAIGGLSENDFIVAAKISAIV